MRKLELVFKTSDEKLKTLSINYANGELTGDTVNKAMTEIAKLKMFDRDGIDPYATPIAAQYRKTEIDKLFDTRGE
ncbi:DUF2922 domain-containing protein [Lentilactobacillus buchneri]|uniref:DUF2922 domain-containing protein n=1 Tax=Lentilactobacillus buchneri TaxID=1581 RepID=UPI0002075B5C|nr:DUF2922 domain-containing protein [Lentilactobacillus buchneri]AEB72826.1 hypothetical protein Lbuc_0560 [Lentilactobacillus buchneri NRRL B-30929]MCT2899285.1 DUF2922 domain-containing protein [Lentilactobacillus buchneri]MQM60005.1 DUF2922 domain-containing protein [Lentilactobacillus buchneri]MQM82039.1 DUF2922 domain-containing protein [Lentilactobacillus buchneri]MQN24486.1 DUF2922 domain-containing protein [Lentilactobacillus buchneri]